MKDHLTQLRLLGGMDGFVTRSKTCGDDGGMYKAQEDAPWRMKRN